MEEIMAKNFKNLMKSVNSPIQKISTNLSQKLEENCTKAHHNQTGKKKEAVIETKP